MIQKTNPYRLKEIGKIFLQSFFYIGSIVWMLYVGYSRDRDKDWSLIKVIHSEQKKQKAENFSTGADSTYFTFSRFAFKSSEKTAN